MCKNLWWIRNWQKRKRNWCTKEKGRRNKRLTKVKKWKRRCRSKVTTRRKSWKRM